MNSRVCHSPILRLAAVTVVALAWSTLAFGAEIHDAAKHGDLGKVQALLKRNPDLVFSKDKMGLTPLHVAASYGHREVAELLLANRADENARDKNGNTPLTAAAAANPNMTKSITIRDVAELLLSHGADVDAKNNYGATPLIIAAFDVAVDVAEFLLAHGADVNAKDINGETPLGAALESKGVMVMRSAFTSHTLRDQVALVELLRQRGGIDCGARSLLGCVPTLP